MMIKKLEQNQIYKMFKVNCRIGLRANKAILMITYFWHIIFTDKKDCQLKCKRLAIVNLYKQGVYWKMQALSKECNVYLSCLDNFNEMLLMAK